MVSSTIDHMVAVTVFLAATLLFIGLFNQTIQTAVLYQQHRALATKASDLLDGILLCPGIPVSWGQTDVAPTGFGLQDPEFTQYRISPYSLMRLNSSTGQPVYYNGQWYSNVTIGGRNFMLVSSNLALNYSTAARLLGINNTYGFQLTLRPIVTVSIEEMRPSNPLTIRVKADGIGFPLSYATISYCFLKVNDAGGQSSPSYDISFNTTTADSTGSVNINIPNVNSGDSYALVVYAREGGLVGVGYHERTFDNERYVIPFIDSFDAGRVLVAHSYDVHYYGPPESAVFYNATYVLMTEDFTLRQMPISNETGKVVYGHGTEQKYDNITIPTHNPGILVITYNSNNGVGVVMMPWGISSLAFPVTFGGDASQQEWVATDMRQVTVGGIAYQAQIAVWSLQGYQVKG
ncbi:MAG: hypothetical protein NWE99_00690 [Candidatus Bathyarchaeota archaeon]|nr:hypothetical protein [Candidatus Bathyarchaeota archaeon]